jgi:hypothetical protein
MRTGHRIGTRDSPINNILKPATVSGKELHQSGHDLRSCTHVARDIQCMTHMDVIPDPHMMVSALAGRTSDDGGRKQVRAKRSQLQGAVTLKKTSEPSQTRQIVLIRQIGQELLVLYNDWGHYRFWTAVQEFLWLELTPRKE